MSEPYTMLPNWLIDAMPGLSEAALKVCLVVARKTIGWHKESDKISLSQFKSATHLHRETITIGIAEAEQRGLIAVTRTPGKCNEYRLSGGPIRFDAPASRNIRPVTSRKNRHTKEIVQPQKNADPVDYSHFKQAVEDWPF